MAKAVQAALCARFLTQFAVIAIVADSAFAIRIDRASGRGGGLRICATGQKNK